jgi:hypothetical protein
MRPPNRLLHQPAAAFSLAVGLRLPKAAWQAIGQANDLGDLDTADLFTEVSRGIDRWLWFVEAHLQAEQ